MVDRVKLSATYFVTALCYLSKFPFGGAEDINNARLNLTIGRRTDFWGSFAPWFFNLYQGGYWEVAYATLFSLLITFTFFIIVKKFILDSVRSRWLFLLLVLQYLVISFSISLSRDSGFLAFATFAIGAWIRAFEEDLRFRVTWICFTFFSLIIGTAFRPWLSVSLPFLLIALNYQFPIYRSLRRIPVVVSALTLILTPALVDQSLHRVLNLTSSFPQQQVMIMDLSSMACLSSDRAQTEKSLAALRPLATATLTKKELCSQFFPQSWASVIFYSADRGQASALTMVKAGDVGTFAKLQKSWLNAIFTQLPSYVQTKIMLGSQFLIAGESPKLEYRNLKSILQLPFEFTKAIRVYSAYPALILLLWIALRKRGELENLHTIASISLFYLAFLSISIIAFIGDNQRYIFPGTSIVFLFALLRLRETHDIK